MWVSAPFFLQKKSTGLRYEKLTAKSNFFFFSVKYEKLTVKFLSLFFSVKYEKVTVKF
jgi:hypothetical protein